MSGRWAAAGLALALAGCGGRGPGPETNDARRHWGGPRLVAQAAEESAVAIDGRGHAFVAWTTQDGRAPSAVLAVRHPMRPGASALPARVLNAPGTSASGVSVVAAPAGALVAWREQAGARRAVCASRLAADASAWTPPQCWDAGTVPVEALQLALGADGSAIAAWTAGGVLRANTLR